MCAVLLAFGCGKQPARTPEQTYSEIRKQFRQARFAESLEGATQAGLRFKEKEQPLWHARFELLRCEVLLGKGDLQEARKIVEQPLPQVEGVAALEARRRFLEGYTLSRESRFEEAYRVLEDAAGQAERAKAYELLAPVYLVQGQVCDRANRLGEAEPLWRKSLEAAERSGDAYDRGAALVNLGMTRVRRSQYDEAVPFFEQALAAARQEQSPLLEAAAFGNMALCKSRVGDLEQALEARKQANAVFERTGAQRFLLQGLGESGNIHLMSGRPDLAAGEFRRALELARRMQLPEEISDWATALASALIETGNVAEVEKLNDEAAGLCRQLGDAAGTRDTVLNKAKLLAAQGRADEALKEYASLFGRENRASGVLWEAYAGAARVYRKLGRTEQASRHFRLAIEAIDDARADLMRQDSAITFQTNVMRFYREAVSFLIDQKREEEALALADSSRAHALLDPLGRLPERRQRLSVAGLKAEARRRNAVFLSYWLGSSESHVWVISAGEFQRVQLGEEGRIRELAGAWRSMLENSARDPLSGNASAGRGLYAEVIAPVEKYLRGARQVIVVPDGALHTINLETLPVGEERPHYWLEDAGVAIAPSLSVFSEGSARRGGGRRLLLIGDPKGEDAQFPRLPHAAEELAAVRKAASATTEIRGAAAVPEAYLEGGPAGYDWIHFAAHAKASASNPLESAVILSRGRGGYRLTAWEVLRAPLRAELVTLSACQSAGARSFAGEGMVGFAWAFMKAGASNVVASLWDAGDRSTMLLVQRMYEEMGGGKSPAAALREAKMNLLRAGGAYAKPFYWGAFQVYTREGR